MKNVYYRVMTPVGANIYARDLAEARERLQEYGKVTNPKASPEHLAYWAELRDRCYIVKVTEIQERVE